MIWYDMIRYFVYNIYTLWFDLWFLLYDLFNVCLFLYIFPFDNLDMIASNIASCSCWGQGPCGFWWNISVYLPRQKVVGYEFQYQTCVDISEKKFSCQFCKFDWCFELSYGRLPTGNFRQSWRGFSPSKISKQHLLDRNLKKNLGRCNFHLHQTVLHQF